VKDYNTSESRHLKSLEKIFAGRRVSDPLDHLGLITVLNISCYKWTEEWLRVIPSSSLLYPVSEMA
jgi:hypothetical protein